MRLLYATDGFDAALAAGRAIAGLFRRDNALVTVASVTHSGSLDPGHIMLELDRIEDRRKDSAEITRVAQETLQATGFDADAIVLEGRPGRELVKEASSGRYDVVVVGSGSHSWAGNHLLGSVSTLILHEAPCSVLVTHEFGDRDDMQQVLIAVDGSETSSETVTALRSYLDPGRVRIEVLSVADVSIPAAVPVFASGPYPSQDMSARMESESRAQARSHVEDAGGLLRDAGFQVDCRVERGGAISVILDEARRTNADLVAMGSRGLGPVRRALLGSVSDQVSRHASAAFVGRFPRWS